MNEHGITAVVLRYRMPNGHPEIPLKDAQTALKLVRQKAADWHVDPNRVGIMGFFGRRAPRRDRSHPLHRPGRPARFLNPDLPGHLDGFDHASGSKDNLLGTNAPAELAERYSNENRLPTKRREHLSRSATTTTAYRPPTASVTIPRSKKHNVPAELHVYPSGGHGWGWRDSFEYHDELRASLGRWLEEIRK